jgi:hypothetical protein
MTDWYSSAILGEASRPKESPSPGPGRPTFQAAKMVYHTAYFLIEPREDGTVFFILRFGLLSRLKSAVHRASSEIRKTRGRQNGSDQLSFLRSSGPKNRDVFVHRRLHTCACCVWKGTLLVTKFFQSRMLGITPVWGY